MYNMAVPRCLLHSSVTGQSAGYAVSRGFESDSDKFSTSHQSACNSINIKNVTFRLL